MMEITRAKPRTPPRPMRKKLGGKPSSTPCRNFLPPDVSTPNFPMVFLSGALDKTSSMRFHMVGSEENLPNSILHAGGNLAILSEEKLDPKNPTDLTSTLDQWAIPSRFAPQVFHTHLANHFHFDYFLDPWIRDYMGFFCQSSGGQWSLFGSSIDIIDPSPSERQINRGQFSRALARVLGIPFVSLNLLMEGGNVVPIGERAVVSTSNIIYQNYHLPEKQIAAEFGRMGRPELILIPSIDDLGHADTMVADVNGSVFCLELWPQAYKESKHVERGDYFRDLLDQAAHNIENRGFPIHRLPLPLPLEFQEKYPRARNFKRGFSAQNYVSPLNLVQVRNAHHQLIVFVPWPKIEEETMPDQRFYGQYRRVIRERLTQAGADKVHFVPFDIRATGGAFHCTTAIIPRELLIASKNAILLSTAA